ncbi:hypothetical protein M3Y98_00876000 [Aphelenchoides besseyi]|nr:hypothetical protein M3Y98_00876000 [Aphelenchoides besseyi]KAI6195008.1 hypothetical protein M3Y96_01185500 [Aphelenchoides besseyi]
MLLQKVGENAPVDMVVQKVYSQANAALTTTHLNSFEMLGYSSVYRALVFCSVTLELVTSQEIYDIYFDGSVVEMHFGSPAQIIFAFPSTNTDVIFVVDVNCGQVNSTDCSRYCHSHGFREIYCPAKCQEFDDTKICKQPIDDTSHTRYNPINSSTFSSDGQFWKGNLEIHSEQIGLWSRDQILLPSADSDNTLTMKLDNWQFVDGVNLDSGLISSVDAFLGLGPGNSNFVSLLYKKKQIPKPVISIATMEYRMTVGDFNHKFCPTWLYRKAASPNWLINLDSATFMKRQWNSDVMVTFNLISRNLFIPDDQFDYLLQTGVLSTYVSKYYRVRCDANFDLKFTLDGNELLIPSSVLIDGSPFDTKCYTSVLPIRDWYPGKRLYKDEANWVLGLSFLDNFCIGYNYETQELGISSYIES